MLQIRNSSHYEELLKITEEILHCLRENDDQKLMALLDQRRDAFRNIHRGSGQLPKDVSSWIRRIRKCEDQCTAIARDQKERIHLQRRANRNRIRLGNTYHKTQNG